MIFHGDEYYQLFLLCLAEASKRFKLEIMAYCLMGNHYHLFVKTPLANLDRCMRHINGIYTQRYNKLRKTDGTLFRGRYKSILVEADAYGLQLSRYIHRNPVETKRALVEKLEDYPWSSYPAYLNKVSNPVWLQRDLIFDLLGAKQRYIAYARYVESGTDAKTKSFYSKTRQAAILGKERFIEQIKEEHDEKKHLIDRYQGNYPSIQKIIVTVAEEFDVDVQEIRQSRRGRGSRNIPRWVALYLCRELSQATLSRISGEFGLTHISGVSQTVYKLQRYREKNALSDESVRRLYQCLTP